MTDRGLLDGHLGQSINGMVARDKTRTGRDRSGPVLASSGDTASGPGRASKFQTVDYRQLNGRQQEVFNYHHIAALLAKHGYATYPIRDDWNGGDMFARHMLTGEAMTIQIKSRITFDRKYLGKNLCIGFRETNTPTVYVYPHDEVLREYEEMRRQRNLPLDDNQAWSRDGTAHWISPTKELRTLLQPYRLDP